MRFLSHITALLLTLVVSFSNGVNDIDDTREKGQTTARNGVTRRKIIYLPDFTTKLEQVYASNTTTEEQEITMAENFIMADEKLDNNFHSEWASIRNVDDLMKYVTDTLKNRKYLITSLERDIKNFQYQTQGNSPPKTCDKWKNNGFECIPPDCVEAFKKTGRNGIRKIKPPCSNVAPFHVYCLKDATGDGDPWTVIQRRLGGIVDFDRTWNDYKNGFGNLNGEFWLGLDKIHAITNSKKYELRITLTNWTNDDYVANYDSFLISNEESNYTLMSLGKYTGNATDSMSEYSLGQMFSTPDVDNDAAHDRNCAVLFHGGWWLHSCGRSMLNAKYPPEDKRFKMWGVGVYWRYLQLFTLQRSEMAIRARKFKKPSK